MDGVRRESEQLRTQWKHSIVFCFVDFQSARENGPRGNFARVQFIVDTNRIYRDIQFFTVLKFIYFETPIGVEKRISHFASRSIHIFIFHSRKCIVNNPRTSLRVVILIYISDQWN